MLSSIIEKKQLSKAKELTTVAMPKALIEGAESIVLFTLMIIFPIFIVMFNIDIGLLEYSLRLFSRL
jgi:hypothetical protein